MSSGCIVRIESADGRTNGWQARVYTVAPRYVSRLFSDRSCGGQRKAKRLAQAELPALARRAARVRRNAKVTGLSPKE